jgi:hypothetical protein
MLAALGRQPAASVGGQPAASVGVSAALGGQLASVEDSATLLKAFLILSNIKIIQLDKRC